MIDGHCHLDKKTGNCAEEMKHLHAAASVFDVKKIILLNLPELAFDNDLVIEEAKKYNDFFCVFPSVNPVSSSACPGLERLRASGAWGLKLHPRLHGYRLDSKECLALLGVAGKLKMPVMVDCFPDGRSIALGNTPDAFASLAERLPDLRIALGHSGGHRILDALMVAKYFKNIYLDLSYTLLYYRNSSVIKDIAYAIENIKAERIFWGSDYPDRGYEETVNLSMKEFEKMGLSDRLLKPVLTSNAEIFLGENK
jgi:predicted TIM-barrel fold metal-dependent hydrolase